MPVRFSSLVIIHQPGSQSLTFFSDFFFFSFELCRVFILFFFSPLLPQRCQESLKRLLKRKKGWRPVCIYDQHTKIGEKNKMGLDKHPQHLLNSLFRHLRLLNFSVHDIDDIFFFSFFFFFW